MYSEMLSKRARVKNGPSDRADELSKASSQHTHRPFIDAIVSG